VTPNFDDLLARSLDLFGTSPLVCDHPYTASRIDPESDRIQIVHVHGSHHFYDLANLDAEIYQRTQERSQAPFTIPELLRRILWDRSPLVIGYSGWTNDVIMTTLQRRLRTPLTRNLYWFCHDERHVERLPGWLKNHTNVYFVVAEGFRDVPSDATAEPKAKEPDRRAADVRGSDDKGRLPAYRVLSDLISTLKLKAPALSVSPIGFFHDRVASAVEGAIGEGKERDSYYFSEILERIRVARDHEERKLLAGKGYAKFLDAARRAAHGEMAALAEDLVKERAVTIGQLREVEKSLEEATASASLAGEQKITALRTLDGVLGRIAHETGSWDDKRCWVKKRIEIALELYELGEVDDELRIYDDIDRLCAADEEPAMRALVIHALEYKANTLSWPKNDDAAALALLESVEQRFGRDTDPLVVDALAEVRLARAYALKHAGTDCEPALNEIIDAYQNAMSHEQQRTAVRAMSSLAFCKYEAGDIPAELEIRERISRFTLDRPYLRMERLSNFREIAASLSIQGAYLEALEMLARATSELREGDETPEERLLQAEFLHWKSRTELAMNDDAAATETLRTLTALRVPSSKGFTIIERAYRNLYDAYMRLGKKDAAKKLCSEITSAAALDPSHAEPYIALSRDLTKRRATGPSRRKERVPRARP
jgi:tetratricopeptide (TPR) repeat protein